MREVKQAVMCNNVNIYMTLHISKKKIEERESDSNFILKGAQK